MKKLLCLVLALLFVMPLAACAGTSPLPGLNNDIVGNAEEIEALEAEIAALKDSYDQKLKQLNDKVAVLENDKVKKETEIKALKDEINKLKADYEERISALEEQLANTTVPQPGPTPPEEPTRPNVTDKPDETPTDTPKPDDTETLPGDDVVTDMTTGTDDPSEPPIALDPITEEPYVDLRGYNYKAIVCMSPRLYCEDFWVEEASFDALSYAVYERNRIIEESYNCKIQQENSKTEEMYDKMTQFYMNEERYELAILPALEAAKCTTAGLLTNIYELEEMQLDHAAYDQNAIREFTMANKLYYFSGDMNISTLDSAAVTIFNYDLFCKYNFVKECDNEAYDDLYEMVQDQTWTISAMMEMAEVVSVDAAGDGGTLVAADGDQVGYYAYKSAPMYYWYGCGARISTLDEDHYPSLIFGRENGNSEELYRFFFNMLNNQLPGNEWIPNGPVSGVNREFQTDALLFTDTTLKNIRTVLHPQDTVRFGILPIPKYDEEQSRYYDVVYTPDNTVLLWAIPKNCAKLDSSAYMTNLIAVYSNTIDGTMDGYYTKTLMLAVARDGGSRNSLQIIRDSLTYDIFLLYDWGGFITKLIEDLDTCSVNEYREKTTVSSLKSAVSAMESTFDSFRR